MLQAVQFFKPSVPSAFDEGPGLQYIQYFCNTCCFALFIFRKLKLLNFYGHFAE